MKATGPYLPSERIHRLDVVVLVEQDVARVAVHLNGERVLRWEGTASLCVVDDPWPAGNLRGAILLAGWTCPTAFLSAEVCNLTGHTELTAGEADEP